MLYKKAWLTQPPFLVHPKGSTNLVFMDLALCTRSQPSANANDSQKVAGKHNIVQIVIKISLHWKKLNPSPTTEKTPIPLINY